MRTQRKPPSDSIFISPRRGSVKWIFTPSASGTVGVCWMTFWQPRPEDTPLPVIPAAQVLLARHRTRQLNRQTVLPDIEFSIMRFFPVTTSSGLLRVPVESMDSGFSERGPRRHEVVA